MCVFDQNYALVIVTEPKRDVCNPFQQEDSGFISYSTIEIHFFLGLSSFGELNLLICDRVILCACMTKITLS